MLEVCNKTRSRSRSRHNLKPELALQFCKKAGASRSGSVHLLSPNYFHCSEKQVFTATACLYAQFLERAFALTLIIYEIGNAKFKIRVRIRILIPQRSRAQTRPGQGL